MLLNLEVFQFLNGSKLLILVLHKRLYAELRFEVSKYCNDDISVKLFKLYKKCAESLFKVNVPLSVHQYILPLSYQA